MPTLAPKLPYDHPFAGGYPRLGGQPLPTDPDAIDYLERVAAADGAAVEVGVAMAVDAFVKGCKADGTWSALKASCIMCGARTISGALVPLVGTAPTNVADGFVSGDYNRKTGLKGDGTSYLSSNRADDADPQNDSHRCVYISEQGTNALYDAYLGIVYTSPLRLSYIMRATDSGGRMLVFERDSTGSSQLTGSQNEEGFIGSTRSSSASFSVRVGETNTTFEITSAAAVASANAFVFARNLNGSANSMTSGRLAFYSIGEALDLETLDARVTALVTAIGAAI